MQVLPAQQGWVTRPQTGPVSVPVPDPVPVPVPDPVAVLDPVPVPVPVPVLVPEPVRVAVLPPPSLPPPSFPPLPPVAWGASGGGSLASISGVVQHLPSEWQVYPSGHALAGGAAQWRLHFATPATRLDA